MLNAVSKSILHRFTHRFIFAVLLASLLIVGLEVTHSPYYIRFQQPIHLADLCLLGILILYCFGLAFHTLHIKKARLKSELFLLFTLFLLLTDFVISLGVFIQPFQFFSLVRIFLFFLLYYDFFTHTSLHRIVKIMQRSHKSLLSVIFLLFIVLYSTSLIAYELFSKTNPEIFGSLADSFLTLFRTMVADNLGDTVEAVSPHHPYAPFFFIFFMVISGFIIMNLFVSVLVDGFAESLKEKHDAHENIRHQEVIEFLEKIHHHVKSKKTATGASPTVNLNP
ncbi:MAG: ion transporter [Alphaproteobacteria bacterium]